MEQAPSAWTRLVGWKKLQQHVAVGVTVCRCCGHAHSHAQLWKPHPAQGNHTQPGAATPVCLSSTLS